MSELVLLSDERACWLPVSGKTAAWGFEITPLKGKIRLVRNGKEKTFTKETTFESVRFLEPESSGLHAYRMPETLEFGRELPEQICPQISARHFQIRQGLLEDLSSTNGTYVNGKRVHSLRLQSGDEILAGPVRLFWYEDLLLSSAALKLQPFHSEKQPEILWRKGTVVPVRIPPLRKEIEKAKLPLAAAQPRLFQSIGSSLMILVSTLASAGLSAVLFPERKDALLSTLTTSFSMAGAFLAYGLISRNLDRKDAGHSMEEALKEYSSYLHSLEEEIRQVWDWYELESRRQVQLFEQLDPSLYACGSGHLLLPAGTSLQSISEAELPKITYESEKEGWVQMARTTAGVIRQKRPNVYWLEPGSRAILTAVPESSWVEQLWLRWLLVTGATGSFCLQESLPQAQKLKERTGIVIWNQPDEIPPDSLVLSAGCPASGSLPGDAAVLVLCPDAGAPAEFERISGWPYQEPDPERKRELLSQCSCHPLSPWLELYPDFPDVFPDKTVSLRIRVLNEAGQIQPVDLSEEGQGPHVLVAGTTGSGKSEFLASLILQLCLQNPPEHFQFLMIDFKGGALAGPFYEMPHFAGAVSNLQTFDMVRFEQAMEYETARRQNRLRLLQQKHPQARAHIDSWNEYYPQDPESHLFVIVDEFAQLKSRMPESMNYIKELARIGRSLGIHLILATQKPGGIVDEQIWSNSQLRICMKVHSAQDSREVVGHSQAAYLNQPGAGYMAYSGSEEQIRFDSLYTRDILFHHGSWQASQDQETFGFREEGFQVLEKAVERILEKQQPGRMLLQNLSLLQETACFLAADRPWKNDIRFLSETDEPLICFLCSQKDDVQHLRQSVSCPCFCYGSRLEDCRHLEKKELFWMEQLPEQAALLYEVRNREDLLWADHLQNRKHLLLVLYAKSAELLPETGYRLASRSVSLQQLRCFLSVSIPAVPEEYWYCLEEGRITAASLGRIQEKQTAGLLPDLSGFLIGLETETAFPVWFSGSLLILTDSAYGTEQASRLLQAWSAAGIHATMNQGLCTAAICVIDLCTFQDFDDLNREMQTRDSLYIGREFFQWTSRLYAGAPACTAGTGICWQDGQVRCLERIYSHDFLLSEKIR